MLETELALWRYLGPWEHRLSDANLNSE
jgi:hypothetical protein